MAHYDAIFKNGTIVNQDGPHAADLGIRVNTAHRRLTRARQRAQRQYRRAHLPGNRFVHVRRS